MVVVSFTLRVKSRWGLCHSPTKVWGILLATTWGSPLDLTSLLGVYPHGRTARSGALQIWASLRSPQGACGQCRFQGPWGCIVNKCT